MSLTYRPKASIPLVTTVVGSDGKIVDFGVAGYASGAVLDDQVKGKVVVSVQDRLTGVVAQTLIAGVALPLSNIAMFRGSIATEAVITIAEGLAQGQYIATFWYLATDIYGKVLDQFESDLNFDVTPAVQSAPPPVPV